MSRQARLMIGLTLLSVPTIVYGGATLLGVLSEGAYGAPSPPDLSPLQQALYRAGHAHAGVLMILSLILQIALDHVRLAPRTVWAVRIIAPVAAVTVAAGFFGTAHLATMRWFLYMGATGIVIATLATGIGLLRRPALTAALG